MGKILSGFVFWIAVVMIGVLAIPTVLLLGLIFLIWSGTDFLLKKFDKE